jgi:hypothetical protein
MALQGYGTALTYEPPGVDDRNQDPAVHGETAAESLNDSITYAGPALKNVAIVNNALLGLERHDLSGLLKGTATVMRSLGRNERQLQDLVTNFNTTMASFASQSSNLKSSIRLLGPTLHNADSALTNLNASLPNTRAFAREILPGVRETPATIDASMPWIRQTRALLGQGELRGLARELRPATADLSNLVDESLTTLPQADLLSQCVFKTVLPTGDVKIEDGPFTTGVENYKEFWYTLVGLAGEGQNSDGNGGYVRFAVGGGDQSVSTGKYGGAGGEVLRANFNDPPLGTKPAFPGKRPPYNSTAACKDQGIPNLNAARQGPADGSGG